MTRRKHANGYNRRTTPKNGDIAQTTIDGETVNVKWCKNHSRWERTQMGQSGQVIVSE